MSRLALLAVILVLPFLGLANDPATRPILAEKNTPLQPLVSGLNAPTAVAVSADGRLFVAQGGAKEPGDASIVEIKNNAPVPFVKGIRQPRGLISWQQSLFVAEPKRIWRVNLSGKAEIYVEAKAFPQELGEFTALTVDPTGMLYVADQNGTKSAIYRVEPRRRAVSRLVEFTRDNRIEAPAAMMQLSEYHLQVVDARSGALLQVRLSDGEVAQVGTGFASASGLAFDYFGRQYVALADKGELHVIARPGENPVLLASGLQAPRHLCLSREGNSLFVTDAKAGTLLQVPTLVPGQHLDESKLPVDIVPAFPDLQWSGWEGVDERGRITPHRPIVLTHANDDSGRVFVATQQGVIHTFPNDQTAKKTKIFLDLQNKVKYSDATNEEGFLGLAFHPQYKTNGEFFVFYTPKHENLTNVVCRFRVSKEDPDRADPTSEERLLTFKKPFWNHDGGTICFGPDGYLYITHGDGGAANDPFGNGQNLKSLLGKVLRINVDKKDPGKAYSIPSDNPFVGKDTAREEIWAYGFRNIWRMSFDTKTGKLWAADVGQNLWEEIDLVEKGGNYGWKTREGLHPFGVMGKDSDLARDMIDPIWEYHHDIGKSITGGHVYRGKRVPQLEGLYLYADYVSGTVWALRYDEEKKRVTAHHEIRKGGFPVFSFGEDERGEIYLLTSTPTGKGLFWFAPAK